MYNDIISKIEQALAELGLTPAEITVYLELMHLGMAPASVIAKRVGLPRSTVHYTCQQLRKKGLASVIQRQNTFLFSADDPSTLKSVYDLQRRDIQRKEERFDEVVRQLRTIRNPQATTSGVRLLEGKEGIAAGFHLAMQNIKTDEEVLGIIKTMDPAQEDPHDVYRVASRFEEERAARKIPMRALICNGPRAAALQERHAARLSEARILKGTFPFPGSQILLFANSALCATAGHHSTNCFIIDDTAVLGLLRALFESAWKGAK